MMICGPAGSGKSTLMKQLLEHDLYRRYHYVFFFGPTNIFSKDDGEHFVLGENWFVKPDLSLIDEILSWILKQCPERTPPKTIRILFMIDDIAIQIKKYSDSWTELINNRRHLCGDRVKLALIISCHRPKGMIVPNLRLMADSIVLFRPEDTIREVFQDLGILNDLSITRMVQHNRHQFIQINKTEQILTLGWDFPLERIKR